MYPLPQLLLYLMSIGVYSGGFIDHTYDDAADNFNIHDQCDNNQSEQWLVEERPKEDYEYPDVAAQSEINSALKFPGHQPIIFVRSVTDHIGTDDRRKTNYQG